MARAFAEAGARRPRLHGDAVVSGRRDPAAVPRPAPRGRDRRPRHGRARLDLRRRPRRARQPLLNWLSVAAGIARRIVAVRERYDVDHRLLAADHAGAAGAARRVRARRAAGRRHPRRVPRRRGEDGRLERLAARADRRPRRRRALRARRAGHVRDRAACDEIVARGVDPAKVCSRRTASTRRAGGRAPPSRRCPACATSSTSATWGSRWRSTS